MRLAFRWSAVLTMLILLTGCWDSRELNDQAFALGGGVDYIPEKGYKVTNQFALISGEVRKGETSSRTIQKKENPRAPFTKLPALSRIKCPALLTEDIEGHW